MLAIRMALVGMRCETAKAALYPLRKVYFSFTLLIALANTGLNVEGLEEGLRVGVMLGVSDGDWLGERVDGD
eukprot:jgi/Bigna1/140954/aug1.59_g15662